MLTIINGWFQDADYNQLVKSNLNHIVFESRLSEIGMELNFKYYPEVQIVRTKFHYYSFSILPAQATKPTEIRVFILS